MSDPVRVAIEGAYRATGLFGVKVWRNLVERLRNERATAAEMERLHWERLLAMLRYCANDVPFYRRIWKEHGVEPGDLRSASDIAKLPVVTREMLSAARMRGEFSASRSRNAKVMQTSGTTAGAPFAVMIGLGEYQTKYANHLRQFYATGWRLGMRSAALHYSGHGQFRGRYSGERGRREPWHWMRELVFGVAHRRIQLTPYHKADIGDDEIVASWYSALRRHAPFLIDTFYINLLMLADYIERNRLEPVTLPRMFVLGTLTSEERERIGGLFGGQVFNRYSPHECEGVAVACERHEGLHVAIDSYRVEILDDDGRELPAGETGNVVVTDLENYTMPLIRYSIGDLARGIEQACPCGRAFPRISDIEGRSRDALGARGGRRVAPWEAERILQGHPSIRYFQIVRERERIRILVVLRDGASTEAFAGCAARIGALLEEPVEVVIEVVDRVRFEANGKFLFVKNADARRE